MPTASPDATLELVDVPSESLHEAAIRDRVRELVPVPFEPVYEGDEAFFWARDRRPGVPLLVLAGHYDTVPAQDNLPGRIEDGAVHGCGASDMKGGVAVALELVRDLAAARPVRSTSVSCSSAARSCRRSTTRFLRCSTAARSSAKQALAVLLEPTDLTIQAGCLGNLSARVIFHGVSGHSARPWLAENAIHAAVEGLARIATLGGARP